MANPICYAQNIVSKSKNKKRCRDKLDVYDEHHRERWIKSRPSPEVEDELSLQMLNLKLTKRKFSKLEEEKGEEARRVKLRATTANIEVKFEACRISSTQDFLSNLPTDILFLLLEKLLEPIDHVRFAAVCKEWHSLAQEYNRVMQPWCRVLPPMLWISCESHGSNGPITRLYSTSEGINYSKMKLPLPGGDRFYCGFYCGHGWFATLKEDPPPLDTSLTINLVNPFRKATDIIYLPHISKNLELFSFTNLFGPMVILSADPTLNPDTYVFIVLFYSRMYFIRGGQEAWTCMDLPVWGIDCATYYDGRVYAFRSWKRVVSSFQVNSSDGKNHSPMTQNTPNHGDPDRTYLVKSTQGDLLVVERYLSKEKRPTDCFRVYKWVIKKEDGSIAEEVEVQSIGSDALFVSDKESVCVMASNFPGCRPNSIYYTNDCKLDDVGIFHLEDRTITLLHSRRNKYSPPSIWITPSFPVC